MGKLHFTVRRALKRTFAIKEPPSWDQIVSLLAPHLEDRVIQKIDHLAEDVSEYVTGEGDWEQKVRPIDLEWKKWVPDNALQDIREAITYAYYQTRDSRFLDYYRYKKIMISTDKGPVTLRMEYNGSYPVAPTHVTIWNPASK